MDHGTRLGRDTTIVMSRVTTGRMWVVLARRTVNEGTRYEHTTELPAFYMNAALNGGMDRTGARKAAALLLGADLPGMNVRFEVHLV